MRRAAAKRETLDAGRTTRTTKRYATRTRSRGDATLPLTRWYEEPDGEAHEAILAHVRNVKTRQVRRRYEMAVFQQMYCNNLQNIWAASGLFSSTVATAMSAYTRISLNVVKSCIDTATARIAKSKPRAFALPSKGDYRLKTKAKNLTKYLDGAMRCSGFYAGSEDCFRDSGIYGTGYVGLFPRDGQVHAECIKVDEAIIDQVDGMYDDPQEIAWEHPVSRSELLARYPEHREQIEEARMSWRGDMAFMSQKDLVLVVEIWRKPSIKDGKDGRHVVAIINQTLLDEPWKKPYLPIIRFHWTPPTYGPFGQGIALELEGMQWTVTNIMRDIAESIHKFAVPRVWVDSLSGVSQHTITNELSVNKFTGQPPVFMTPTAMAADVYQYLQWLIDNCYKGLGLSQLTAQSEKPAGLNSGVAMRTYQDIETQRFAIVGQRWERFYMSAAEIMVDIARDLYAEKGELTVKVPGRGFIESVDWKDASLEEDQYDLRVYPTNLLPEEPMGRLQTAQEMIQSGFMSKEKALEQIDLPVLHDWIDAETAPMRAIERALSSIVEDSKYIAPQPTDNLDMAVQMVTSAIAEAQADGTEPHKQDLLQRYLDASLQLKALAAAPPPGAAPPAAGGAPVGQAPAPPTAPLAPAGAGPIQAPQAAAA